MSGPQRFRKKPAEIEAMQFDGTAAGAAPVIDWVLANGGTARFVGAGETHPMRYETEYLPDQPYQLVREDAPAFVVIDTLEGAHRANPGDWIIRGVPGEFYPCRPDIFEQTYESAIPMVSVQRHAEPRSEILNEHGEFRHAPGTVVVKVEHEHGNTVRGPITTVLSSHLADGWHLASVDVEPADDSLTATAAIRVRVIPEGEPFEGSILGTVALIAPPEHVDEARRVISEALRGKVGYAG